MTREHTKALMPVLLAWSEGRDVECFVQGRWRDPIDDNPCFSVEEWRVKPGEFWVVVNRMTAEVCCRHTSPPKVDNDLYYVRREVV